MPIDPLEAEDAATVVLTLMHLMEVRMNLPEILDPTHRHGLALMVESASDALKEAVGIAG